MVVSFAPGMRSPMHYTKSLDYGIILEGEVELLLDNGDIRVMKAG
jgi:quercetin dioxygenase-like cupin family protein